MSACSGCRFVGLFYLFISDLIHSCDTAIETRLTRGHNTLGTKQNRRPLHSANSPSIHPPTTQLLKMQVQNA